MSALIKLFHFYSRLIHQARSWIYFIASLAILWTLIGAWTVITFPGLWPVILDYLQRTFYDILGDISTQSPLRLAGGLLKQNAQAALSNLLFGLGFGLLPTLSVAVNFFAVGFLAGPYLVPAYFPEIPGSLGIFVLSIMPHGIFEFPALLLATAFGLRLGWLWVLPQAATRRWVVFKSTMMETFQMVPLVLVLLVAAAFIEAFVTAWLVK